MEPAKSQLTEDLHVLRIDRQAKKTRRKLPPTKVLVIGGLLLIVLVTGVYLATRRDIALPFGLSSAQQVQVAVATRRGAAGEAQPVLTASGYIVALKQVDVSSKITGRIVALHVEEGDLVQQGQIIAQLDDSELKAEVNKALAGVAQARARLAALQSGSRPPELGRARAEVARAEADLKNAELTLNRDARLVKEGVLPQQALDDSRARYEMARNALRVAQENSNLVQQGPRREDIDLAKAQLSQAEAELQLANAELQNTIIRAPINGTVLNRFVDIGAMVTTGFTSDFGAKQALVSIADMNDLQIELDITEADIARLELGQPALISLDVYPDRRYHGELERIAAAANRQKSTLQVKVKVLDPDSTLRSNMSVKVTFYPKDAKTPERQAAILVPQSAVTTQEGRTVVFLAKEGKVVIQPVTASQGQDGYASILSGLQGGETVITSGQTSLKNGDEVAVKP